jgi:Flp pilus assembly protein TadB
VVVIWIVIAVVVVLGALLVVLEVQNRRRRRALEELEDFSDPTAASRAMADADAARSTAEGVSKTAHPGGSAASGMISG